MTGDLFRPRGLPEIIPERIKEAREARGYTRDTFAAALGISEAAVGQYEVGQHSPGPEIMAKIISTTGQPPAFFSAEHQRVSERLSTPFWRSLAKMNRPDRLRISRRLEWAADVVTYVSRFIEFPPPALPAVTLPTDRADVQALESAAEQ